MRGKFWREPRAHTLAHYALRSSVSAAPILLVFLCLTGISLTQVNNNRLLAGSWEERVSTFVVAANNQKLDGDGDISLPVVSARIAGRTKAMQPCFCATRGYIKSSLDHQKVLR